MVGAETQPPAEPVNPTALQWFTAEGANGLAAFSAISGARWVLLLEHAPQRGAVWTVSAIDSDSPSVARQIPLSAWGQA